MKRQMQKAIWCSLFLSMLSITVAFICWQPEKAEAASQVTDDGFKYHFYTDSDEKQWTVIDGYNGTETDLTIPAQIEGYDVMWIAERAFENNDIIQSVTIEEGIMEIGNHAFTFCDNLQTISIPASVSEIDAFMFEYSDRLSEINIAEEHGAYVSVDGVVYNKDKKSLYLYPYGREGDYSVLENVTSISSNAFFGCSKIKNITLPATVTSLGTNAFADSSVVSVNLPQGLKTIGSGAFMKAKKLESLSIPSTVTTVGRSPFWGCKSLTGFEVASGNSKYASSDGVIFNKSKTVLYWYPGGKTGPYTIPSTVVQIKESAFVECEFLTEIKLSAKLSIIEDGAFMECSGLKEVELPSGVTSIGESVFSDCSALERISLPSAMTTIGKYALSGCASLKELTLPDSLKSIDSTALYDCSELENIFIADTNATYSSVDGVLFNKEKTTLIRCPEGKPGTYVIPEGVTAINSGAFYKCKKIDTIVLPSSIETLTNDLFNTLNRCGNLSAIDVAADHPTYQSIEGALYGRDDATLYFCSRSKTGTFVVPEGVSVIDTRAFQDCVHLSEIILPDTVTVLKSYAFHNCAELKHITIPNGVTELSSDTFDACELESITIPENVTKISVYAFGYTEDRYDWGWNKLEKQPVVRCFKDSAAHTFAESQKLEIELLTRLTTEMVSLPASVTYKTESMEPEITVKDGDRTLQKDVDYDVAYSDNDRAGTATVIVTGKGSIVGTITKTFEIEKATPSYTVPEGLTAVQGQKLLEVALPVTDKGTWHWKDADTVLSKEGTNTYPATFTPVDIDNYTVVENIMIQVKVSGKISDTTPPDNKPTEDNKPAGGNKPAEDNKPAEKDNKPAEKGTKLTSSNGEIFCVTASGSKDAAVEFVSPGKEEKGSYTVPAEITIDKITYKVTSVGANAFADQKKITNIVIGKNIKTIGKNAFKNCTGLKNIKIENNVTTISECAFYNCTRLSKITIPQKVTSIGKYAFGKCKNLKIITIKTKKLTGKKVGSNAFKGIYAKANIKVPKTKLKAYKKLLKAKGVSSKAKIKK